MSKNVKEVISHFESLYSNNSLYLWGANGEIITKELCDKLYKAYGSSTYNQTYYNNKLKEGQGKIGADCSGAFYPVSGFDTTAQGYYNKCSSKGVIVSINRNKPCLVFKGKSTSAINHIGFYLGDGHVIEMKSSKENCVKSKLDGNGWKWFGIPTWIDYSSTVESSTQSSVIKAIDVSSYQGSINWNLVKSAGVYNAILRGVTKNGELDTKFETNYTNAIKYGVNILGAYHFSYALNDETAKNDAINMVNKLNGKKIDIYLDLEWSTQRTLGKDKVTSIAKTYVNTCKSLGYNCHIYSNLDWYKNVYNANELESLGCKFWIARYYNGTNKMDVSVNPNEQYNPKASLNKDIFMWQYTSSGQVAGINGNVDLNVIYGDVKTSTSNTTSTNTSLITETSIELMGKVTTQSTNLTIRKEPNKTSTKLGSYKKGAIIRLLSKTSNGWYKTSDGYISGDYVTNAIGKVFNCVVLNMRKEPEVVTGNIIKTLAVNAEVYLLKDIEGWYKIKTKDNVVGYVSKKYIKIL